MHLATPELLPPQSSQRAGMWKCMRKNAGFEEVVPGTHAAQHEVEAILSAWSDICCSSGGVPATRHQVNLPRLAHHGRHAQPLQQLHRSVSLGSCNGRRVAHPQFSSIQPFRAPSSEGGRGMYFPMSRSLSHGSAQLWRADVGGNALFSRSMGGTGLSLQIPAQGMGGSGSSSREDQAMLLAPEDEDACSGSSSSSCCGGSPMHGTEACTS